MGEPAEKGVPVGVRRKAEVGSGVGLREGPPSRPHGVGVSHRGMGAPPS